LAEVAKSAGFDAAPAHSVQEALRRSASGEDPVRVLLCGSLYLAGHVLRLHSGR
jgi:dihydrofolate synthase/folylpolyglutamate synthase